MKKLKTLLTVLGIIGIIGELFIIDYNQPDWNKNAGAYIGILSMVCLLLSFYLSDRGNLKNKLKP